MSIFGNSRRGNESDVDRIRRLNEEDRIYNQAIDDAASLADRQGYSVIAREIKGLKK